MQLSFFQETNGNPLHSKNYKADKPQKAGQEENLCTFSLEKTELETLMFPPPPPPKKPQQV